MASSSPHTDKNLFFIKWLGKRYTTAVRKIQWFITIVYMQVYQHGLPERWFKVWIKRKIQHENQNGSYFFA